MTEKQNNQAKRLAELKDKHGIVLHGNSDAIHLLDRIETVIRDQILETITEEMFEDGIVEETDDKYSLLLSVLYYELIYKLNTDAKR
tara:strand:+ start:852 stop:1112 length:261 start_codon:yes stop_codon:yes gene_type:complete